MSLAPCSTYPCTHPRPAPQWPSGVSPCPAGRGTMFGPTAVGRGVAFSWLLPVQHRGFACRQGPRSRVARPSGCVWVCAAQSPMIHDSSTRTWVLRVLRGPAPPCAGGRAKRPPAAFARVLYHRAISIYLSPPEPGPHPGCFAIEPYHDRAERSPCAARRRVSMSCPVSTRPCLVIVITPFDSRFSMLGARTTRQLATYATCTSPHARTGRRRHVDGRTTTTTLSSNPPAAA